MLSVMEAFTGALLPATGELISYLSISSLASTLLLVWELSLIPSNPRVAATKATLASSVLSVWLATPATLASSASPVPPFSRA